METSPAPEALPAPDSDAPRWQHAICWQVYPLGFCGAPLHREDLGAETYGERQGDNVVHRLDRIVGWLDHLLALGADVLILNPIFDSVSHGYDTLDHLRVDPRLGDEADLEALIAACRERGISLVLDGVFNHVSHLHPLVRRALADGPDSPAGACIRWSGAHPYGFEGNEDLVELNLAEPAVQERIAQVMNLWLDRGIDGWRLDAMYAAGPEAWAPILDMVRAEHPEAWILGEVIHGDYRAFAEASEADSITQYELWKAIWSSIRETNLFELAHALGRHEAFVHGAGSSDDTGGGDGAGGVMGSPFLPLTFLGNHDTTRIASQLEDGRDLAVAFALLALLPGIPAIYAGDELGAVGAKEERAGGDDAVRPLFPASPDALRSGMGPDGTWHGETPVGASPSLALLSRPAAPRIFEVHQRLLGLRRREGWLATARVRVDEDSLTNASVRIVLEPSMPAPSDGPASSDPPAAPRSLALWLNLGDDPLDLPNDGEVLAQVSGADMLDAVGPAAPDTVPPHGAAVAR
ncbi:alpha-amylase family glycosyl hydrolase [Brachybacterium sp. ACRRE]|uniref:alpha-amylase family glycosyl hydrolase n=1 Tax=Brachybacterium sp. ACRRE TaxID=2918184 RepID=UPI001EF1A24B|nr:alpha-amylase family glycosyl hydrolase [Brachybacterium sp. ACRRE]MCG7308922.1 alpha-amylase family glycosyl hydrolase [Brachybacterium sp. ACRRE]